MCFEQFEQVQLDFKLLREPLINIPSRARIDTISLLHYASLELAHLRPKHHYFSVSDSDKSSALALKGDDDSQKSRDDEMLSPRIPGTSLTGRPSRDAGTIFL